MSDEEEAAELAAGPAGQLFLALAPNADGDYEAEGGGVRILMTQEGTVRLWGPDGERNFGSKDTLMDIVREMARMLGD